MENNVKNQSQIAGAIIIAGLIIAGAILLKGMQGPVENNKFSEIKLKAVSADEHILGNSNSKIIIVEYSDTECPFCKVFHNTMNQVIAQTSGKVAWVYRHYPIAQLHPKAFLEAVAMECAWEQGGNDLFWKYTNELFARTPSNNKLEVTELSKIAKDIGLNIDTFNTCLSSEKYSEKVKADMSDGDNAGVRGTPQSFILKNGKIIDTIDGAQPLEVVMQKVQDALK
jgi:protein-disulfide isomerase